MARKKKHPLHPKLKENIFKSILDLKLFKTIDTYVLSQRMSVYASEFHK